MPFCNGFGDLKARLLNLQSLWWHASRRCGRVALPYSGRSSSCDRPSVQCFFEVHVFDLTSAEFVHGGDRGVAVPEICIVVTAKPPLGNARSKRLTVPWNARWHQGVPRAHAHRHEQVASTVAGRPAALPQSHHFLANAVVCKETNAGR